MNILIKNRDAVSDCVHAGDEDIPRSMPVAFFFFTLSLLVQELVLYSFLFVYTSC